MTVFNLFIFINVTEKLLYLQLHICNVGSNSSAD
jgi:hypothetical protein